MSVSSLDVRPRAVVQLPGGVRMTRNGRATAAAARGTTRHAGAIRLGDAVDLVRQAGRPAARLGPGHRRTHLFLLPGLDGQRSGAWGVVRVHDGRVPPSGCFMPTPDLMR